MTGALTEDADPEHARMLIGKFALEAETIPEEQFVENFRHLDGEGWPRRYVCTAVDAETGAFIVWDGGNQAELPRAVASSCAVPGVFPPITIDGRRYIDGGMRSGTNADLAEGNDRVLIVSLMGATRLGATTDPRMERYRRRMDHELMVALGRRRERRAPRPRRRGGRSAGREPDGPHPHPRGRRNRNPPGPARGRPAQRLLGRLTRVSFSPTCRSPLLKISTTQQGEGIFVGGVVGRVVSGIGSVLVLLCISVPGAAARRCPPVPSALPVPTIDSVMVGDGNVAVSVHLDDTGSTPLIGFVVSCTSTDFGVAGNAMSPSSPVLVSGLTNNASYTCTATVTDGLNYSAPSPPWGPFVIPSAPSSGAISGTVITDACRSVERLLRGGGGHLERSAARQRLDRVGRYLHVGRVWPTMTTRFASSTAPAAATTSHGGTAAVSVTPHRRPAHDGAASVPVVNGGTTTGINGVLSLGAHVTGTVTDTDDQPLKHVCAGAIRELRPVRVRRHRGRRDLRPARTAGHVHRRVLRLLGIRPRHAVLGSRQPAGRRGAAHGHRRLDHDRNRRRDDPRWTCGRHRHRRDHPRPHRERVRDRLERRRERKRRNPRHRAVRPWIRPSGDLSSVVRRLRRAPDARRRVRAPVCS